MVGTTAHLWEGASVDFDHSAKTQDLLDRMQDFMDTRVLPAEVLYEEQRREKGRDDHTLPPVVEELKAEARSRGLWNLFLPDVSGLTNVEYAAVPRTPGTWRCCTCSAPPSRSRSGSSP
jgi:acyl-CoA dehydrogenase